MTFSNNIDKFKLGLLDFHNHSKVSDGSDTPTELVKRAKTNGVSAIALTDHNVISGLEEFNYACSQEGLFAIPFGVEIYVELPKEIINNKENEVPDLIILGKNAKSRPINDYYSQLYEHRVNCWLPEIFEGLKRKGFVLPKLNIEEIAQDLGVPKILHNFIYIKDNLKILIDNVHEIDRSIPQSTIESDPVKFMNKYLYASGREVYSKRISGFSITHAVKLAEEMNCRIFIAHPGGEYNFLSDEILNYFIENRIHGIEVRNYFNTPEQNKKFDLIARKNRLIRSGGSDCHGENGPFKIGMVDKPKNQLPKDILEELWDNLP